MERNSENYHTNGYASSFMNRLWKLAVSQSFTCDIILKHGWKHFYLHSSVLAVACPHLIQFLETKLEKHNFGHAEQLIMDLHSIASHQINIDTVNLVENKQKHNGFSDCESKFQKYSAEVLGLVWKFIYLGSIELTEDNVTEVENIANLLKQESLTRYCSDFKSRNMKKQDCSSQLPIVVCITTIPGEQDGPEDTPFHKRQPLPLLDTVTVNEVPSLDCGKDFLFTSQDSLENKTETNNTDMAHKEQCDVSSLAVQQALINAESVSPIQAMNKDKNKTKTTKIGCLICTKLFSNINTLMKHLLKHKEDLLKCKYCNKNFDGINSLQDHAAKFHFFETKYKCTYCDKEYVSEAGLKVHEQTAHKQIKAFSCQECGKKFSQKGHLKEHFRVHTKEKQHVCSFCGLSYCSKVNLRRHESSHTGSRPFKCRLCQKSFAVHQDLDRHYKFLHSEVKTVCDVCGIRVQTRQSLNRHAQMHSRELPHQCQHCLMRFAQKNFLRQHEKLHEMESFYDVMNEDDFCQTAYCQPSVMLLPTLERPQN